MRILALSALFVLPFGAPVLAQGNPAIGDTPTAKSAPEGDSPANAREWEIGASLFGFGNGNFIQKQLW